jgi:pimeloyl-ACP methyl ester carboxylesterase
MRTAAIDQHLLKVRSPVDGMEIPYHVSAPNPLPSSPLPAVFLLHDALADPSPGAFIEEAFRAAADWKDALADGPPALLVQTWGRGNAAWCGAAGRALFDVWRDLEDQFLLNGFAALVGRGAGGTGALQLAAQFPHRVQAVAALDPWTDERLSLPFGTDDHPAWERDARRSIRPVDLAARFAGRVVLLGHASTGDAFASLTAKRHFDAMTMALAAADVEWQDFSAVNDPFTETKSDLDRGAIWNALARPLHEGRQPGGDHDGSPDSPFWRPLTVVVGTLGETEEVDALRGLAERIGSRWSSGEDSRNLAPGDRRLVQKIPVLDDSEAVAETPDGDLLLLGSPRLHLLAAKWKDRLGVAWPSSESDEFAVLGRTFAHPSALAAVRSKRPDGGDGRVTILTAGSYEAWAEADRLRFAFLPDVFVQAKPGELLWMNLDED